MDCYIEYRYKCFFLKSALCRYLIGAMAPHCVSYPISCALSALCSVSSPRMWFKPEKGVLLIMAASIPQFTYLYDYEFHDFN